MVIQFVAQCSVLDNIYQKLKVVFYYCVFFISVQIIQENYYYYFFFDLRFLMLWVLRQHAHFVYDPVARAESRRTLKGIRDS